MDSFRSFDLLIYISCDVIFIYISYNMLCHGMHNGVSFGVIILS